MLFFNSLVAVASVGLFFGPALGAVTEEQLAAISANALFETIPGGTNGNCDGKDIDTMVREAVRLNDVAIQAIDTLTQDKLLLTKSDEGRLGLIASAMWGVHLDRPLLYLGSRFRVDAEGKEILKLAKENYVLVNEKLLSGSRDDDAKLACGDTDFKYANTYGGLGYTGEIALLPLSTDLFVSQYWTEKDEQGRYILEQGKCIAVVPNTGANGKSVGNVPFCSGKGYAVTWANSRLIMMCDHCFDGPTLSELYDEQEQWEVGKNIDSLQTAGAGFQHEMFHYLNKRITDQQVDGQNAYGWLPTAFVADQDVERALKNADNYRVFSMALFFDKTRWDEEGLKEA